MTTALYELDLCRITLTKYRYIGSGGMRLCADAIEELIGRRPGRIRIRATTGLREGYKRTQIYEDMVKVGRLRFHIFPSVNEEAQRAFGADTTFWIEITAVRKPKKR